ncbi:MAG: PAS domain S-box protein [Syntrophobacteraceae bacterium]
MTRPTDNKDSMLPTVSLNTFLARLIWACVLPLVILTVYLAVDHVRTLQNHRSREANDRVRNVLSAVDRHIEAHIAAMQMLAASPLMDDPPRFDAFYREATNLHDSFGGHIILADPATQMIFNTRTPLGTSLPKLPVPRGHAAAPKVLATGKPAVGDMFMGPVANVPLVTIVVPLIRDGQTRFLLVNTLEAQQFQRDLDDGVIPPGWALTILDGKDEIMARRAPQAMEGSPVDDESPRRFVASSTVSPWSVVLEIPGGDYRATLMAAAATLGTAILAVTLVSVIGGRLAARRLARSVSALAETGSPDEPRPVIAEIKAARDRLDEAAEARDAAERTRLEAEQRFRQLFDFAPLPLCYANKEGSILNRNARFMQVFGYDPETVPTLSEWWQLAYPDPEYRRWVVGTWETAVRQARENHTDIEPIEYRMTCRNGSELTMLISGTILGDDLLATFFDVTERRQTEEALLRSEERLRWALHAAKAGTWEWDLQTSENHWSEELWSLYGLEPHSIRPSYEGWRQTVHPDDRQQVEEAVLKASQAGTELNVEWRAHSHTVEERWLMSRGQPMRDAYGRVVRYVGLVMDITDRKKAELARRQWADAFEHCAHGIAIGAPSTNRILACNPAFARMHGVTPESIVGRPILTCYAPSEHEHVRLSIQEADRVGQVRYETLMQRDDGSTFPVQMDVVSVRDSGDTLLYRVATMQDITERKQSMDALHTSLEEKVSLLKEVHHRVKNNLQIVASLLSLQLNRLEDPHTQGILEDTRNRVRSMALLHEVLYRSGNLARIDFAHYSRELCAHLLRAVGSSRPGIRIENRIGRIELTLEQSVPCGLVMNELVTNALKHGFPDGRSGAIVVDLVPGDDGTLCLSVSDDGVGMAHDCDPLQASTLGMKLVSRLAGQLKGELSIESAAGTGALFRVAFSASGQMSSERA